MAKHYQDLPVWEHVPEYHLNSPQSKAIIEVLVEGDLRDRAAIRDTAEQLCVHTATWGLDLWEQLLLLPTDHTQSLDTRRAAIIAKLMGTGVCNADMIRAIAASITGLDSVVVERTAEYEFAIVFVGEENGLADINRTGLIDAVEEVKPAHLKFVIEPLKWQDPATLGHTWESLRQAAGPTWGDIMAKVMVHKREEWNG